MTGASPSNLAPGDDATGRFGGHGRRALFLAFFLSGAAGLAYELVWTRYLGLLLGHGAYAQVLVIAVYLGGIAVGSIHVARRVRDIRRPLVTYAIVELALCVAGLAFHPVFTGVSGALYSSVLPALGQGGATAIRWLIGGGLILPQAILLGATFPLMSSGTLRAFPMGSGRVVADVYFWNTLGGAVGILGAGFVILPAGGTIGCLLFAALGNLLAAATAYRIGSREERGEAPARRDSGGHATEDSVPGSWGPAPRVWGLLLSVSFFTAAASFLYEIGWIRALSLVMGAATHSFELMLSAFILGLAVGSYLIRARADRASRPFRLLGWIQWFMGALALATLPLYAHSFELIASFGQQLPRSDAGYVLFGLTRYGLALTVMLPATVLAGMTLPLVTATLLRRGLGERAIGWVYGVNTLARSWASPVEPSCCFRLSG